jgi:hypothetical protein
MLNTHTLKLGAIDKTTKKYVLPCNADKKNKYFCPDCEKDLIFKKGQVKAPHFAHYKTNDPCNYYNHPSESQIHKDAKMALKSLLDNHKNIIIEHKKCKNCCNIEKLTIKYTENDKIELEHYFEFNNSKKIADVAFLSMNTVKYIFEIFNTHRTSSENRPEPWFEFDAKELITIANTNKETFIFQCIRDSICCPDCQYAKQKYLQYHLECLKQKRCINHSYCNNEKYLKNDMCYQCHDCLEKSKLFFTRINNTNYISHLEDIEKEIYKNLNEQSDRFGNFSFYDDSQCISYDKHVVRAKITDKFKKLFITKIDDAKTIDELEEINKKLNSSTEHFRDEFIDKINVKKILFENEITKYTETLTPIINNYKELHNLLEEIQCKQHLFNIVSYIKNKLRNITYENTIKINELNDKIDKQKNRIDKLYAIKEEINSYLVTDNDELTQTINKVYNKITFTINRFQTKSIYLNGIKYILDNNNNIYDIECKKFLGKYFNKKLLQVK